MTEQHGLLLQAKIFWNKRPAAGAFNSKDKSSPCEIILPAKLLRISQGKKYKGKSKLLPSVA